MQQPPGIQTHRPAQVTARALPTVLGMILAAQSVPIMWVLIGGLVVVGLVVFACIDPELSEVYVGDWQLLVAAVALAVVVVAVSAGRAETARELGGLLAVR